MSICRLEQWPKLLAAFIVSRRAMPFEWGKNDCGLFAADAILAMTGVDLAAEIRGTYSTEAEANAALANSQEARSQGAPLADGYSLLAAFAASAAKAHGMKEGPVLFGQRGDLCLYPHLELGDTLVIVGMEGHQVLGPGANGLASYDRAKCSRCWRVPF